MKVFLVEIVVLYLLTVVIILCELRILELKSDKQIAYRLADSQELLYQQPLPQWIQDQAYSVIEEYDIQQDIYKLIIAPQFSNLNEIQDSLEYKQGWDTGRKLLMEKEEEEDSFLKGQFEGIPEQECDKELDEKFQFDTVFGGDDRVKVEVADIFPFSAVVRIQYNCPKIGICTGVMIGPDTVLTAAHCVQDPNQQWRQCTDFAIIPGSQQNSQPFGNLTATKIITAPKWSNSNQQFEKSDYALLKLDKPIGLKTGWFGVGYDCGKVDYLNANVTGYPNDYGTNKVFPGSVPVPRFGGDVMVTTTCNVTIDSCSNNNFSDELFEHECDTAGGQSGAPIYVEIPPTPQNQFLDYQVLGIHVQGSGVYDTNKAVYISFEAIQWIIAVLTS